MVGMNKRTEEEWEEIDKRVNTLAHQKRTGRWLTYALLFCGLYIVVFNLAIPLYQGNLFTDTSPKYENGFDMEYNTTLSAFVFSFDNPDANVISMETVIKAQSGSYIPTVFERVDTEFPVTIEYTPFAKDLSHLAQVTLVRETGNVTYFMVVTPSTAERNLQSGLGGWL